MITDFEILETMKMFNEQHLDIRTITMGISLMDCAASSVDDSGKSDLRRRTLDR